MGHAYIAVGPGTCRVLSVCSDSETQLMEAAVEPRKAAMTVSRPAAKPGRTTRAAPEKQAVKPKGRSRAGKN